MTFYRKIGVGVIKEKGKKMKTVVKYRLYYVILEVFWYTYFDFTICMRFLTKNCGEEVEIENCKKSSIICRLRFLVYRF